MDKHSAIAARVEELLTGFDAVERTKGRAPAFVAEWLGFSLPTTYRRIERGEIRSLKIAGAERRGGRGTAGLVRVTLLDAARFRAEREIGADVPAAPEAAHVTAVGAA